MYFTTNSKTRSINAFLRTKCLRPKDIFARFGARVNPKGGYSTTDGSSSVPAVEGTAVIQSMIIGQETLRKAVNPDDDLPPA